MESLISEFIIGKHIADASECFPNAVENSLPKIDILFAYLCSEIRIIHSLCHCISDYLFYSFFLCELLSTLCRIEIDAVLDGLLHPLLIFVEPSVSDKVLQSEILIRSILLYLMCHLMHEHIAKVGFCCSIHVQINVIAV